MTGCGKTAAGGWRCSGGGCMTRGACLLRVADPIPAPDRLLRPMVVSRADLEGDTARAAESLLGRAIARQVHSAPSLTRFSTGVAQPGNVQAALERAMELVKRIGSVEPRTVHGGQQAITSLFERFPPRSDPVSSLDGALGSLIGIPMYVCDELPPNTVEFRGKDGEVLSRFVVPEVG